MSGAPKLLVSDKKGNISIHPKLEAAGMKAGHFFRLHGRDLVKLPAGSRLFMLPSRLPVGHNSQANSFVAVDGFFAVAAFVRPGFTVTHSPSYSEYNSPKPLPIFSYAALAFYKGELYTTAVMVDKDRRHDQRFTDIDLVRVNAEKFKKLFARNRLIAHLKSCALTYGCPNAQNFFLSKFEAPLPVSPSCNARCSGCISFQSANRKLCASQPRIKFTPTPEELGEIALFHIKNVKDPILSFGQGCEGEPLLEGGIIDKAIKIIRKRSVKGIININTNGSATKVLARLFDSGLDSVRISLNSAQAFYYNRYYKPIKYKFSDVASSIRLASVKSKFVSLNYLTMPGFTDSMEEFSALVRLIERDRPDMIQWRNLNYDPLLYFRQLQLWPERSKLLGIEEVISRLRKVYPKLMMGYFNPALSKIRKLI
ncbi:MAG: radical SAM protein [Candidatus Omnitrophota bacterium]|nr:radical SAM protein [Candidatus Omnitrophota bacterium]